MGRAQIRTAANNYITVNTQNTASTSVASINDDTMSNKAKEQKRVSYMAAWFGWLTRVPHPNHAVIAA